MLAKWAGARTAGKLANDLGGDRALLLLLSRTGYTGQVAGLVKRLEAELKERLPLHTEAAGLFANFIDAPLVMAGLHHERLAPLPSLGKDVKPDLRMDYENDLRQFWPWISGQRFLRLSRGWLITGEGEWLRAAGSDLEDYFSFNQPLLGPGWQDGYVIAARAANWLFGLRLLGNTARLNQQLIGRLILHLDLMGFVLSQKLEVGAGNIQLKHVAMACGLWLVAYLLPFLPAADSWLEQASAQLIDAVKSIMRPGLMQDLGGVLGATEWAGLLLWLLSRNAVNEQKPCLQQAIREALRDSVPLLRGIAPPWGQDPQWTTGFYSPVLGFESKPHKAPGQIANLSAILLQAPDLRGPALLDERLFWFYGQTAEERLKHLAGGPDPAVQDLPAAGLSLLAGKAAKRRVSVLLRTAPRSGGQAGRRQAQDALALCLFVDAIPVLVTPGSGHRGALAAYFLSRSAQNAIRVDRTEVSFGPVTIESMEQKPEHLFMSARAACYSHLPEPVTIRRRLFMDLKAGILNITDQLQSRGEHDCEIFFHLPHSAEAVKTEKSLILLTGDFGRLWLKTDPKAEVGIYKGLSHPPLGWQSDEKGELAPAPVVVIAARLAGHARLVTTFTPTQE